jgi:hypothetical protein
MDTEWVDVNNYDWNKGGEGKYFKSYLLFFSVVDD